MNLEIVECAGASLRHAVDEKPKKEDFFIHMHDNYELFLFVRGEADFLVEGNVYPLLPGCLLLMRPAETHKLIVRSRATYERYTFNFSESLLGEYANELLKTCNERPLGVNNRVLAEEFPVVTPLTVFRKMFSDAATLPGAAVITSGLTMLLGGILTAQGENGDRSAGDSEETEGKKVLSFVNDHLCESLTVAEMAHAVGMSLSQFTRTFRALTGTSVHHYVQTKRLILAQKRIAAGEAAASACLVSGFSDYSAFYRAYRKRFGVAPASQKPGRNR